jgi:hypothetical protein
MCTLYLMWLIRPRIGAKVVQELDEGPDVVGEHTTRCARMAAYEFKAEFGELKYNKANRCIASDWVRKHFRDKEMRAVDIVRHMDICVELCLLPTAGAVAAANLAKDRDIRARRAACDPCK